MVQAVKPPVPDFPANAPLDAPRRFRRFLKGSYHHYSAILQQPLRPLVRWLCRLLFGAYRFSESDAEAIRQSARRGPMLYVIRDQSRLQYLALSWTLTRQGLPAPVFAHYVSMYLFLTLTQTLRRFAAVLAHWLEYRSYPNPYRNGYVSDLLSNETPSLLCVAAFQGMPRRFSREGTDTLVEILRCSRDLERPVQVVPIVFIYGRKPDQSLDSIWDLLFGPSANPSRLRRLWMTFRYRNDVSVRVGEIESLEGMAARVRHQPGPSASLPADEAAYYVRREMIARLDNERRVVLGPIRKTRDEIIEAALHSRSMVGYLAEYCRETQQSFVDTRKRARRYLNEMAADYKAGTVWLLSGLLGAWIKRRQGELVVDKDGLEKVRRTVRQMPLVYVPCHKSHLDYLLVSFLLYRNRLALPYILAGINLNFFPVGQRFRNSGAFFLRRVFKGKRIYSRAVVSYIETLLRERQNLEFFIEGGRSRVGKIIPPKIGFISILLDAFKSSGLDDLAFVPVLIDYERIFEEKTYLDEASDRDRKGSKIQTALENRKMVERRIGEVVLEFDDPMSLRALMRQSGVERIPDDRHGQMELASRIAYQVTWRIAQRAKARPDSILATVLLATPRRGILLNTLSANVRLLQACILSRGVPVHGQGWHEHGWVRRSLEAAAREKTIRIENDDEDDEDTIVYIEEEKRLPLTLQRNALVHHYQDAALVATAFRAANGPAPVETLYRSFLFLRRLLSAELIYAPVPQPSEEETRLAFDTALEFYTGKGFVARSDLGLVPTSAGSQATALLSSAIVSYLESYYVIAWTLWKYRDKTWADRDWLKLAMKKGRVLVGIGDITYPEAVHRTHFETALKHFIQQGLCKVLEPENEKSRATRKVRVQDFPELERTLEAINHHLGR